MVVFEYSGRTFELTEHQATLVAHKLRGCVRGTYPEQVRQAGKLSGNPHWEDGALAVADFTEEILVGNWPGPLPLEGKAAEAAFWTLRLMEELGEDEGSTEIAALRSALAERLAALQR